MAIRSILKLPDPILRKKARLIERVDADLRAGTGQRIDHADHDFLDLGARNSRDKGQQRSRGSASEQDVSARDCHVVILCDRRVSMKLIKVTVKPERSASCFL